MDLLALFATHSGRRAHLCAEGRADCLPAVVNTFVLKTEPDLMHQVVGQQGDEDVTLGLPELPVRETPNCKIGAGSAGPVAAKFKNGRPRQLVSSL